MAKIYYRAYMQRVNVGEITIEEAIELARVEVKPKWRDAVIALLEEEAA